jgi:hypothetical protein
MPGPALRNAAGQPQTNDTFTGPTSSSGPRTSRDGASSPRSPP